MSNTQDRSVPAVDLEDPEVVTVESYLREWLTGKRSLRESTQLSYRIHLDRYLVPYLGQLPLTELRPDTSSGCIGRSQRLRVLTGGRSRSRPYAESMPRSRVR